MASVARTAFSDDALGYFPERLDPGPAREAPPVLIRRAKRKQGFR